MSEENREFETWKEVIKNYIDSLNDEDKIDQHRYELCVYFILEKLNEAKVGDSAESDELKRDQKTINKVSANSKNEEEAKNKKTQLLNFYKKFIDRKWISNSFELLKEIEKKENFYNIWICRTSYKKDFHPATHIAKLTHSSSSATSFVDGIVNHNFQYLSTNNLKKIDRDGAYANADLSKQVKFLMLKHNDNSLIDELKDALLEFSDNEHELTNWLMRFQAILKPSLKSDNLAKQIYFPLAEDYHLLTILKSSSLIHAIFQKYFEKNAKKQLDTLRKLKSKEKYNRESLKQFVNVAKVATTLSQPQNVSVLNGKRGGFIRLLTIQPPTWQTTSKPPVTKNSLFDVMPMNATLWETIDYLRDFLLRFERIELSFKDPKKMAWIERWVNQIIDDVFAYCASIQNLPSGWSHSEEIKLKQEHQYFLDPYRNEKEFQVARKNNEWQVVVCDDFSSWLNHKLRGKDKVFTPQAEHTRLWKKLMQDELRRFDEAIEMDIKNRQEKIV